MSDMPFSQHGSERSPDREGSGRVAVVFVHGQGQQRPMKSVRELARTTWITDNFLSLVRGQKENSERRLRLWSTPNSITELDDLRRLTTERGEAGETCQSGDAPKRYDFYEFYWAHLMKDSQFLHVADWLFKILRKPLVEAPRALRPVRQSLERIAQLLALFAAAFAVLTTALVLRFEDKPSFSEVQDRFFAAHMSAATWAANGIEGVGWFPLVANAGDRFGDYLGGLNTPTFESVPKDERIYFCRTLEPAKPTRGETSVTLEVRDADTAGPDRTGPWCRLKATGEYSIRLIHIVLLVFALPVSIAAVVLFGPSLRSRREREERRKAMREREAFKKQRQTAEDNNAGTTQSAEAVKTVNREAGRDRLSLEERRQTRKIKLMTNNYLTTGSLLVVLFILSLIVFAISPTLEPRDAPIMFGAGALAIFVLSQFPYPGRKGFILTTPAALLLLASLFYFGMSQVEDGRVVASLTLCSIFCITLAWRMQFRALLAVSGLTILAALSARMAMLEIEQVHQARFTLQWILPLTWGYFIVFGLGFFVFTLTATSRFRWRLIALVGVSAFAFLPFLAYMVAKALAGPDATIDEATTVMYSPGWFLDWSAPYIRSSIDAFHVGDSLRSIVYIHFFLTCIIVIGAIGVTLFLVVANRTFLSPVLGDSARYLRDEPGNIQERQAIRRAGVELFEKLHTEKDYDRIIVVAHSLGSVVAYDVLTLLWGRRCQHLHIGQKVQRSMEAVEDAARELVLLSPQHAKEAADAIIEGLRIYSSINTPKADEADLILIRGSYLEVHYEFERQKVRFSIDRAVGALRQACGYRVNPGPEEPSKFVEHCCVVAHEMQSGPSNFGAAATSLQAMADEAREQGAKGERAADNFAYAAELCEQIADSHTTFRTAQRNYFDAIKPATVESDDGSRVDGPAWRISDFITLGSPLNYGPFLLTDSYGEFSTRKQDGELPTCPPFLDKDSARDARAELSPRDLRFSYRRSASSASLGGADQRNVQYGPGHGALFSAVSWTNLFFIQENLIAGDLIGGPCWRHFDFGVRDVAVDRRHTGELFAHNSYWTSDLSDEELWSLPDDELPHHLRALRKAMNLAEKG